MSENMRDLYKTYHEYIDAKYVLESGDPSKIEKDTAVLFCDDTNKKVGLLTLLRSPDNESLILDAGVPDDNNRTAVILTSPKVKYVKRETT